VVSVDRFLEIVFRNDKFVTLYIFPLLLFLEEQQEPSTHQMLNPTNNDNSVTRMVDLLEDWLTPSQQRVYMRKWRDARKELATSGIDAEKGREG
jgi:hypothetical protein